jgi:hypothetical protein
MSTTAVQFYGIDDVVTAYVNRQTPAFAVWCGKTLLFRYDGTGEDDESEPTVAEGEQVLRTFLESMWQLTTATYTLKTYDEISKGQKIRPSTEYDTAFQFKICPPPVSQFTGMQGVYPQANNPVLKELQQLREEMNTLRIEQSADDEDDEDDEPETLQEAMIGLLHEPERLNAVVEPLRELISLGRSLMGMEPLPGNTMMLPPGNAITGVRKVGSVPIDPDPQMVHRLGVAINTLEQYDDKLVVHLEKLASVAISDPVKFRGLLSMLDLL